MDKQLECHGVREPSWRRSPPGMIEDTMLGNADLPSLMLPPLPASPSNALGLSFDQEPHAASCAPEIHAHQLCTVAFRHCVAPENQRTVALADLRLPSPRARHLSTAPTREKPSGVSLSSLMRASHQSPVSVPASLLPLDKVMRLALRPCSVNTRQYPGAKTGGNTLDADPVSPCSWFNQRLPVPSVLSDTLCGALESATGCIPRGVVPASTLASLGLWQVPRSWLDLYSPRIVRGHSLEKQGLCPIWCVCAPWSTANHTALKQSVSAFSACAPLVRFRALDEHGVDAGRVQSPSSV